MAPPRLPLLSALLLLAPACSNIDLFPLGHGPVTARVDAPDDRTVVRGGTSVTLLGSVERVARDDGPNAQNPPGIGVGGYWTDPDGYTPCGLSPVSAQADNGQVLPACEVTVPADPGEYTYVLTPFQARANLGPGAERPESDGDEDALSYEEFETERDRVTLVVAPNTPPTVQILRPTATGILYADQLVTLTARATDAEDTAENLAVAWTTSAPGVDLLGEQTPDSTGESTVIAAFPPGQHRVTVVARDSDGATDAEDRVITVGPPNSAPSCALTSPAPGERLRAAGEALLTATVADPDIAASALIVTVESSADGRLGTPTPTSTGQVALALANLSPGTHTLTLRVEDEVGATCVDAVTIAVNRRPTLTGAALQPAHPSPADVVTCSPVGAADPDGDDVTARATWFVDGRAVASGASTYSGALSVGAVLRCELIPDDGLDTGSMVFAQTTVALEPPSIDHVLLTPSAPTVEDVLECSWVGFTSPTGGPDDSTRLWFVGTTPVGTGPTLSSGFARGDEVRCEVTPRSGLNVGPPVSRTVTIGNAPPIGDVEIVPAAPRHGDGLLCTVSGTYDADADQVLASAAWHTQDHAVPSLPEHAGWIATNQLPNDRVTAGHTLHGDVWTCTVTLSDGIDTREIAASAEVTGGQPSISDVTVSPDPPRTGDTLACAWHGYSSPRGLPDASRPAWEINGLPSGNTSTIAPSLVRADRVRCTVTPSDGELDGPPVSSEVVVGNSDPTVTAVFEPADPIAGEELRCRARDAFDPDGDALTTTYAFTVDGAPGPWGSGYTSQRVISADLTRSGEQWDCAVRVSDGQATQVASVSVVIREGPSIALVSPSRDGEVPGPTVALAGTVANADRVTYEGPADSGFCTITGPTFTCPEQPVSTTAGTFSVFAQRRSVTVSDQVQLWRPAPPLPTVEIRAPSSDATLTNPNVTVSGVHSAAAAVTVTNESTRATVGCTVSAGHFTCDPIVLQPGSQTLRARASNDGGEAEDSVRVSYQPPPNCTDPDGDGYGVGPGCLGSDCDESSAAIHPGAAEACNLIDEDCDGLVDETGGCWVTVYRSWDHLYRRCWTADSVRPEGACSGNQAEVEAFVLYSGPRPGAHAVRQCSGNYEHVLTLSGSAVQEDLEDANYNCSTVLGYAHGVGEAPGLGLPGDWEVCPVYGYEHVTFNQDAHFFTTGPDDVSAMTCEGPVFDAFSAQDCFDDAREAECF